MVDAQQWLEEMRKRTMPHIMKNGGSEKLSLCQSKSRPENVPPLVEKPVPPTFTISRGLLLGVNGLRIEHVELAHQQVQLLVPSYAVELLLGA